MQVKAFATGEEIPEGSKYLYSAMVKVGEDQDWTPLGTDTYDIIRLRHFYEVSDGASGNE